MRSSALTVQRYFLFVNCARVSPKFLLFLIIHFFVTLHMLSMKTVKNKIFVWLTVVTLFIGMTLSSCSHTSKSEELTEALDRLEEVMSKRDSLLTAKQTRIDSMIAVADYAHAADLYVNFNNDSALAYYDRALSQQTMSQARRAVVEVRRAVMLADDGLGEPALRAFNNALALAPDPEALLEVRYSARAMLGSMLFFARSDSAYADSIRSLIDENESKLMAMLRNRNDTPMYNLVRGDYFVNNGQPQKALSILNDVFVSQKATSHLRTRAAMLLAELAESDQQTEPRMFFLVAAAYGAVSRGDVWVPAFPVMGTTLYDQGEPSEARRWLDEGLEGALNSKSAIAILRSRQAITDLHLADEDQADHLKLIVCILLFVILALAVADVYLVLKGRKPKPTKQTVADISETFKKERELSLTRFITLCFEYRDRLGQFADFVQRKIMSGKSEDVLKYINRGKANMENTAEFFNVMDNAVLRLFPTLLDDVNKLLRPECQIILGEGEKLNTDLRILAFMRLGVEDTSQIARALGFSVNTIYAYRNRLRARAIDKSTFEADIMRIPVS